MRTVKIRYKMSEEQNLKQPNYPALTISDISGSGSCSIESEIKDAIERGLINDELEPIKCECGSTEFIDKTTDVIEYLEVEKNRFCKKCNKLVGYWSYGKWLP